MKKVTNDFAKLTWEKFRKKLEFIVTSMTANPHFPALQAQVTALAAAAANYYVLDGKAERRETSVLVARNTARIEVTNLLHQLGCGVTAVCLGNQDMLESSGFSFTKTPQKSAPLQQPMVPKLTQGANKGVINVKTSKQKGVVSYNYYIAPATGANSTLAADATWDVQSHNMAKLSITDLVSGQPYFVKVGLVGVRSQEVISDAISYIPQ